MPIAPAASTTPFVGLTTKLALCRAGLTVDEVGLHFANAVVAADEPVHFRVGVNRGAQRDRVRQPLHEPAHLAIVGTTHAAAATLAALVRVVRQVFSAEDRGGRIPA